MDILTTIPVPFDLFPKVCSMLTATVSAQLAGFRLCGTACKLQMLESSRLGEGRGDGVVGVSGRKRRTVKGDLEEEIVSTVQIYVL